MTPTTIEPQCGPCDADRHETHEAVFEWFGRQACLCRRCNEDNAWGAR